MKYSQYIPEYEVQFGKKASGFLKRFAAAMDHFEQKGRNAARSNRQPLLLDDFTGWIHSEKDAELAKLMHECYMEGYNAGKAAV